jgi:EAL domain-containing protein (putative c-di-GMP-specific phosphodiesterase class I)
VTFIQLDDLKSDQLHRLAPAVFLGHPPIPPNQFIAVAEEAGLIIPVGTWVMQSAFRVAASLPGS